MDKNAIKKFATWARRELIDRVRQQAYRYEVEGADADWNASTARGVVLTPVQRTQRQALIERMQVKGYDATIEEVAYTWFDRFCALRYMEVNGFLTVKTRMFSDENGAFRPQILSDALSIELPGLDIDTVIRLKEENKTEELYKVLLLSMCNFLKPILTLFQPDDRGCITELRDYTSLLLPDNLLREGSVPEQMVLTIPEDDWKDAVQIVGWLYQYYNAEPKEHVFANLKKNIKISKKDIPAATQLFTPDWIVRYMVENSLGRLWVEGHPDDSLKANWKYYLEEAEQEPEVQAQLAQIREGYAAIKPGEILCIDPCAGSGHILVYLFEVLVQIYEAYGYPTRDAVANIVQNNLWGLDIDDRAAQLANFAVMMIARRYDKGWFRRGIQPHVMAIQESNGINRDHLHYLGNNMSDIERNNAITQMEALLDEFVDAKEYGSILQPQEYDWETLRRYVRMTDLEGQVTLGEVGIDATQERLLQIIEQGQALAQKYHVVVTNPPYMNSYNMASSLNNYLHRNYLTGKNDLFSAFIVRCNKLSIENGFVSMVTMHSWMFLSRYEQLRHEVLRCFSIVNIMHLGARAFEDISGEVVQTASFAYRKASIAGYIGRYERLVDIDDPEEKSKSIHNENITYYCSQSVYSHMVDSIIAYWISNQLRYHFENTAFLGEHADCRQGIATGNNDIFLRLWFEISFSGIAFNCKNQQEMFDSQRLYAPYIKGGAFRRWYGNYEYVIKMNKSHYDLLLTMGNHLPSRHRYFLHGITWNDVSTAYYCARYINDGCVFDAAGPMCFYSGDELYLLGFLNSKVNQMFLDVICQGLHYSTGHIPNVPLITEERLGTDQLVEQSLVLSKADWDSFETSWDFQMHPLVATINRHPCFGEYVGSLIQGCFELWQVLCEQRFQRIKANEEELNRIFIDIYGLQGELTPEVADKDVTVRKADLGRDIRSLVSYAVGCMLGRYSPDKPGLQFAGGDWQKWLAQQEAVTYEPDKDGILPITDDEYFNDDIVTMFVEWIKTVYGVETLEENLKFIASALYPNGGGSARDLIRQYFLNDFYKDHLKVYQKRPIYWMFDSGKKNGFKCLVYMHRWAKDTVARVRTDYVHEMQSRYRTAIEELSRRVDTTSGSERVRLQKQLVKIQGQDAELLKYEEKVHHLADQMIAIDLDDGVKHNYAIFADVLAPIK